MRFEIETKLSEVEIVRDGKVVGNIKFNAYDIKKRQAFYNLYNKLSSTQAEMLSGDFDDLGVPVALAQVTKQAEELYDNLASAMDEIFGAGSMALLTDDNNDPVVLLQFLAFAATEFKHATGIKIEKYLAPESDVMV